MSGVRAPRLQVLAEGGALPGVLAADVFANNHLAADRFRLRIAASVADLALLQAPALRLDVQAGWDGGWTSLIVGTADALAFDPVRGVLQLEGRDLSAELIETQASETFANRTSSEIVEIIAARHGLSAAVAPTSTPVGRYYQAEHDRVALGQFARATTEWDLLAFLAGQEGFDLFMQGDALRFGPPDGDALPLRVEDCLSLELEHALGLAREVAVTVRSWGTRAGVALEHTARGGVGGKAGGGKTGGGKPLRHVLVRPNLDAEQAQRVAERALADLLRHEWTARATLPGELGLTPRSRVALVGTRTDWDRVYAVSELSRHLDVRRGFTQRLCLGGV